MKKVLISSLIVLIVVVGGWFGYSEFYLKKHKDVWSLVPENSLLVYENHLVVNTWNTLQEHALWKNLLQLESLDNLKQNVEWLDSITGKTGQLDKILRKHNFLFSLHQVSKESLGALIITDLGAIEAQQSLRGMLNTIKAQNGVETDKRIYAGYSIYEIREGKKVFTYLLERDFFAGSFEPLLIEDVVRTINSPQNSFASRTKGLFGLTRLDNDEGNLYLRYAAMPFLFSAFSKDNSDAFKFAASLGGSTFADIRLSEKSLLLSGFTLPEEEKGHFSMLGTFHGQEPGALELKSMVPLRASSLIHFRLDAPSKWRQQQEIYWGRSWPEYSEQITRKEQEWGVEMASFYTEMAGELGLISLETLADEATEKILCIKIKDVAGMQNRMNRLAEKFNLEDSLYIEQYADWELRELPLKDFPYFLLGPGFEGFQQCFYTFHQNYLILTNGEKVLKALWNDIEQDNTWARSVKANLFLEGLMKESNVSFIFNIDKNWTSLQENSNESWKQFLKENQYLYRQFEWAAIQYRYLDQKFYTGMNLAFEPAKTAKPSPVRLQPVNETRIGNPIIRKAQSVRNFYDNSLEFLLLDSANRLHLVNKDGLVLWQKALDGHLVSDIHQIDYYRNGKLQYFMATANSLYLIDRNGNPIPGYPLSLSESARIAHASPVDYDNSRKYRWWLVDTEGKMYLYDIQGNLLEGWKGLDAGGKVLLPPQHIRIKGKDCMMVFLEGGKALQFNRRGELQKGFPLDLKTKIQPGYHVSIGNSLDASLITVITEEGEIIQFNFNGDVRKREQLYKPSKETRFAIVPETQNKGFVFLRQDFNRVSILDAKGELLLEKDYLSSDMMLAQYYNFGAGNEVVVITDQVQEFTYIYNSRGDLVNAAPLESAFEIGLMYSESTGNFTAFKVFEDRFSQVSFGR